MLKVAAREEEEEENLAEVLVEEGLRADASTPLQKLGATASSGFMAVASTLLVSVLTKPWLGPTARPDFKRSRWTKISKTPSGLYCPESDPLHCLLHALVMSAHFLRRSWRRSS